MKTNNSISNAKEDNSLLGCRENLGKEDESEFCFIFIHFLSNHTLRRLDWTWKKNLKKKKTQYFYRTNNNKKSGKRKRICIILKKKDWGNKN